MYRKVKFEGYEALVNGVRLRQIGSRDGVIFLEDEAGEQYAAHYGIVDENGDFHKYCVKTLPCGRTCYGRDDYSCRYNSRYYNTAGYYVYIE